MHPSGPLYTRPKHSTTSWIIWWLWWSLIVVPLTCVVPGIILMVRSYNKRTRTMVTTN